VGLRNRLAILNENYVYADYRTRVLGCYHLLWSLLEYASVNRNTLNGILETADQRAIQRGLHPSSVDSFAIGFVKKPTPSSITIKAYEVEETGDTLFWNKYRKTDRKITVTVPYLADFHPSENIRFPYAYLMSLEDPAFTEFLRMHGIKTEKLLADQECEAEAFRIEAITPAARLNQGHYTNTIRGKYTREKMIFQKGSCVIRTAQPLANLAAYLLEPRSDDGMAVWNMFDRYLVPQWGPGFYMYPVFRIVEETELKTSDYISNP
jgi:dipeptidyl-peptidase-4